MKSKTYAICWDGSIENCLEIEKQLSNSDLDYLIYNVAKQDVESKNWVRAQDIRYYGHVYNALKDFSETDYDIFIFNAGDPVYSNWAGYTKRLEKLMSMDSDIYAIAPNTINDFFSGSGSFLLKSEIFKNLNLSTHTNGIYFALSRELALFTKKFLDWAYSLGRLRSPEMVSGWGLDTVFCSIAIYLNKKIYRDISITAFHPLGTTANDAQNNVEMMAVLESFKEFCKLNDIDSDKIQTIYDIVHKKVRERDSYAIDLKELYVNLEGELDV
jgi:hypothetical protein